MPLPEHIFKLLAEGAESSQRNLFSFRNPVSEAEHAGWNAAVTIEDYMRWSVEGYSLRLNIHGTPYRTEQDDDEPLVELVSDLFEQAVSVSGLRTIRLMRPSIDATMDRNQFLENPTQETAFKKKFYGMLQDWHHGKPMTANTVTDMLDQLPPYVDAISYVTPTGNRTAFTGQAIIAEDQAVAPDSARPYGQRGGGHIERPRNPDDGWMPDARVPRVGKQVIHIATNQNLFEFNDSERIGYMPVRGFDTESSEAQLAESSWQGWEDQPWIQPR